MCAMSPLAKMALACAPALPLRSWPRCAIWLLPSFIARAPLRACLKRSRSSQSAQHQTSHSDVNHRFAAAWQDFIILAQTPTLGQPGEGALDDPATLPPQTVFCFCVLAIAYSFRDSLV